MGGIKYLTHAEYNKLMAVVEAAKDAIDELCPGTSHYENLKTALADLDAKMEVKE